MASNEHGARAVREAKAVLDAHNKQLALRTELAKLTPERHQAIREAYYGVAENLRPLMQLLELADLDNGIHVGPLLDEHFAAAEALAAFEKLNLGGVL